MNIEKSANLGLKDINIKRHKQKKLTFWGEDFCGPDGTATRPHSTVGMTGRHSNHLSSAKYFFGN